MAKRVQIALLVLFVAAFGVTGWQVLRSPKWLLSPEVVNLPDGGTLKLERYAFQARSVRYDLPNRPIARVLERVLPGFMRKRLKYLEPRTTVFCYPNFPGEPTLS